MDRCAVELYGQLVVARGRPERCVDARLESAVVAIATDDPQGQVTSRSSFHIFFLPSFTEFSSSCRFSNRLLESLVVQVLPGFYRVFRLDSVN